VGSIIKSSVAFIVILLQKIEQPSCLRSLHHDDNLVTKDLADNNFPKNDYFTK